MIFREAESVGVEWRFRLGHDASPHKNAGWQPALRVLRASALRVLCDLRFSLLGKWEKYCEAGAGTAARFQAQ